MRIPIPIASSGDAGGAIRFRCAPWRRSIETDRDFLERSKLVRTPYFNEFWGPRDVHALIQVWLERQGSIQPYLSVARFRPLGEFERRHVELAGLLAPHLQRAVD